MRRIMLGLVSTLALSCQAPAQEANSNPSHSASNPGDSPAAYTVRSASLAPPATGATVIAAVASNAPPPARILYAEGQKVELAGALYSTRDGRIVLKTDGSEIFILLENQNLWRMEQRAAFGEREFRVRGQVTKYQERYYFQVGKILETAVKLKHEPQKESEDEKPFWERLMFWKAS